MVRAPHWQLCSGKAEERTESRSERRLVVECCCRIVGGLNRNSVPVGMVDPVGKGRRAIPTSPGRRRRQPLPPATPRLQQHLKLRAVSDHPNKGDRHSEAQL